MHRTIFTAGFLGLLGTGWALADEASTNATAGRISLFQDIKAVVRVNLDEKGIAALHAAFAKGIKPLPEDNESIKTKPATPACCRFPSQS